MAHPVGLLFIAVLLLSGCTSVLSSAVVDKADKSITFEMLRADPNLYKGKILILGGTIEQVADAKQGSLLTVVQKPLDYWGKPVRTTSSGGYYLVFSYRHLDSLAYALGRDITVAAEVAGTRLKALGDNEFDYPLLILKELKLWQKDQMRPGAQTQWGDPLYDPQRQP